MAIQVTIKPSRDLAEPPKANRLLAALPRCWIAEEVIVLPPLKTRTFSSIQARTNKIWAPGGLADRRWTAVVESDHFAAKKPQGPIDSERPVVEKTCQIVRYEPSAVDIQADLSSGGLLVLADSFAPGWQCEVLDKNSGLRESVEIFRTNRTMRGVPLNAGNWRVEFRYRPRTVIWGGIISGCAWLALIGSSFVIVLRRSV